MGPVAAAKGLTSTLDAPDESVSFTSDRADALAGAPDGDTEARGPGFGIERVPATGAGVRRGSQC